MRINEIFYSLQGEGRYAGTPAVFVRFAGCNLRCGFCDTAHESYTEYSPAEILAEVMRLAPECRTVIFTGGEPSLQLTAELTRLFGEAGYSRHIETNGTHPLPDGLDWITCSPKGAPVVLERIDEVKVVFTGRNEEFVGQCASLPASVYSLQPCYVADSSERELICRQTISYVLAHPFWHLSLQTHRLLDIP